MAKVNTVQGPSEVYSKLASSKISSKKIVTDRVTNKNVYDSGPSHFHSSFEEKLDKFKIPDAKKPTSTAKFISELEQQ